LAELRGQQREIKRELDIKNDTQEVEKEVVKIEVRTWSQDYDGERVKPSEFMYKKKGRCEYSKNPGGNKLKKKFFRSQRRANMRSNVARIRENLRRRCHLAFEPFKENNNYNYRW